MNNSKNFIKRLPPLYFVFFALVMKYFIKESPELTRITSNFSFKNEIVVKINVGIHLFLENGIIYVNLKNLCLPLWNWRLPLTKCIFECIHQSICHNLRNDPLFQTPHPGRCSTFPDGWDERSQLSLLSLCMGIWSSGGIRYQNSRSDLPLGSRTFPGGRQVISFFKFNLALPKVNSIQKYFKSINHV